MGLRCWLRCKLLANSSRPIGSPLEKWLWKFHRDTMLAARRKRVVEWVGTEESRRLLD